MNYINEIRKSIHLRLIKCNVEYLDYEYGSELLHEGWEILLQKKITEHLVFSFWIMSKILDDGRPIVKR